MIVPRLSESLLREEELTSLKKDGRGTIVTIVEFFFLGDFQEILQVKDGYCHGSHMRNRSHESGDDRDVTDIYFIWPIAGTCGLHERLA